MRANHGLQKQSEIYEPKWTFFYFYRVSLEIRIFWRAENDLHNW